MATWQFHSFLLPRVPFEKRFGRNAVGLSRCEVIDAPDNWPDEEVVKSVLADISRILPPLSGYWDAEGKAWGNHESNIIEASFDEGHLLGISFCVELREPMLDFIQSIVHLAQRHDLLLFTEENLVVQPDSRAVAEALGSSRAARFLNDPHHYLNELKQTQ